MRNPWWLLAVALAAASTSSIAAPQALPFEPGPAEIDFRAYGLGFLAIDGHFNRFTGVLTLDDADPDSCRMTVQAEAASLQMPSADMTTDALGPDLLDVTRHPRFAFTGRCVSGRVEGTLLLHGTERPLVLQVARTAGHWSAGGLMRRAEWGMGARPLLAGPEVRLRFTVALPAGFPGRR